MAQTEAVELSKPMDRKAELRQALTRFYEKHNLSQLADSLLDEIVNKYLGKESQLSAKLQRKYGESLQLSYLSSSGGADSETKEHEAQQSKKKRKTDAAGGAFSSAAAPATIKEVTEGENRDICSPHFDPLHALTCPEGAVVPFPDILPMDNLSQCRHFLPTDHPDHHPPRPSRAPPPPPPASSSSLSSGGGGGDAAAAGGIRDGHGSIEAGGGLASTSASSSSCTMKAPALIETMAKSLNQGPCSLLYRCFQEQRRVCVMIRRIDGIRGTCTGYLKAFDRHFNMVLADAHETFVIPSPPPPPLPVAPRDRTYQRPRGKRGGKKRGCRGSNKKKQVASSSAVVSEKREEVKEEEEEDEESIVPQKLLAKVKREKEEEVSHQTQQQQQQQSLLAVKVNDHQNHHHHQQQQQQSIPPEVRRRKLPQVLIRGDNIVMIWQATNSRMTHAIPAVVAT